LTLGIAIEKSGRHRADRDPMMGEIVMLTCRCIHRPIPLALLIGWMVLVGSSPSVAGLIMESPTSVGTLQVTNAFTPSPMYTLTLGGAQLINGGDARNGGSFRQSAFKFDLSTFSSSTQITAATFTFTVGGTQQAMPPAIPMVGVSGFSSSNPTVTIPDFFLPQTSIGNTGPLPPNSLPLNETFSLDATAYVQSLVSSGVSNVGFVTATTLGTNVILYGSDPSNPAAFRPSLTINFSVPEPPSLTLCVLAGMIGLSATRVRRGGQPDH
jgi:hypothetical protein